MVVTGDTIWLLVHFSFWKGLMCFLEPHNMCENCTRINVELFPEVKLWSTKGCGGGARVSPTSGQVMTCWFNIACHMKCEERIQGHNKSALDEKGINQVVPVHFNPPMKPMQMQCCTNVWMHLKRLRYFFNGKKEIVSRSSEGYQVFMCVLLNLK